MYGDPQIPMVFLRMRVSSLGPLSIGTETDVYVTQMDTFDHRCQYPITIINYTKKVRFVLE